MDLEKIEVSSDGTYHVFDGRPLYSRRFQWVQMFHPPGLAAAGDSTGAFHIRLDGEPAYERRFVRSFGFYQDRAAVQTSGGWGHIDPSGSFVYPARFEWVGNFQEGLCTVRTSDGFYYHILPSGSPAHGYRWRYAGDYREGAACVQEDEGGYVHIDVRGVPLYKARFLDLDVFHKGLARARDSAGWHHIDRSGQPIYAGRFAAVEPFYNGQARVETETGVLLLVNERGETLRVLRRSPKVPSGV